MAQEKKKDETGKKPEEMELQELEEFISLQSSTKPVESDGETEQKEERQEKEETEPEKREIQSSPEQTSEAKKEQELIWGKFKSYEDAQNSYKEAEKKISLQGEEVSTLRKQIEDYKVLQDRIQQAQQPQFKEQTDPLAQLRPYFPEYTDEQIKAHVGLIGLIGFILNINDCIE